MYASSNPKQKAITEAIGTKIALDQPYSIVDDRGFRHLINVLDQRFQMPSRTTFSRSVIPKMYNYERTRYKSVLSTECIDKLPSFSFTTDGWSLRARDHYLSFTISYISEDFLLRTFALKNKPSTASQTADIILGSLERSMEEWELPYTVPIFAGRDNGSNLKATIRRPVYFDIPCFPHTLQLAIGDAVDDCDGMKNMLTRCRKVVTHYHHSLVATDKLNKKMIKWHGDASGNDESCIKFLVMPCPTLWNSDFFMVDSLLSCKEAVSAEISESGSIENSTASEWKFAAGYGLVLSLFAHATTKLCGEKHPMLSMKIPAISMLHNRLSKFIADPSNRGSGITLAHGLTVALNQRFPSYKRQFPDCVSTLLDSRFKALLYNTEETVNAVLLVKSFASEHILARCSAEQPESDSVSVENDCGNASRSRPSTSNSNSAFASTNSTSTAAAVSSLSSKRVVSNANPKAGSSASNNLWDDLDKMYTAVLNEEPRGIISTPEELLNVELDTFIKSPPIARVNCPLKWLQENKVNLPTLALMARAFWSIPATQAKSERLNSVSDNAVSARRACTLLEHVT